MATRTMTVDGAIAEFPYCVNCDADYIVVLCKSLEQAERYSRDWAGSKITETEGHYLLTPAQSGPGPRYNETTIFVDTDGNMIDLD